MKLMRAMAFGAVLTASGLAAAQPARPAVDPAAQELLVGMRDLDQDGRVSWDEAWLFALADFLAADTDGSGDLTPDEFPALLLPEVAQALGLSPGIILVGGASPAGFRSFDADRDGVVTWRELSPFVAAEFLSVDVQGD